MSFNQTSTSMRSNSTAAGLMKFYATESFYQTEPGTACSIYNWSIHFRPKLETLDYWKQGYCSYKARVVLFSKYHSINFYYVLKKF